MKKIVALLFVCIFALATFAGCATSGSSPSEEDITIGVIFYSNDDALGSAVYATLNHAADALGIELNWKIGDMDATSQITAAENLISAGCDGILCMPMSESATSRIARLCNDNQVFYANCFRTITDESIKAEVEAYEYFVGCCYESEIDAAAHLVQLMADAGHQNCAVDYVPVGGALALRNVGFDQGIETTGMNKLAEYMIADNPDLNATISTIQNYINTYEELDVIFQGSAGMGQGEAIINTINSLAPGGEVQLATFDVFSGMKEAFEDGTLACAVGGISPDALFTFIMLYNAVNGTPLSDQPEYLTQNYIFVTNAEEADSYEQYIDNPNYMLYTAEDIRAMSKADNPDFSMDELRSIMEDYTLENIMAKVAQ